MTRRKRWASLLALLFVATWPVFASTQIRVAAASRTPIAQASVLVLVEARNSTGEVVSTRLKAPGGTSLDLDPESDWQITAVAPGYWSPGEVVVPGQDEASLQLFPASTATSRLKVPQGEEVPTEILLVLREPHQTGVVLVGEEHAPQASIGLSEVTQTCPVVDALWSCTVPASVWDIRVRARGFISHYLWAQDLKAGETLNLGNLRLKRGASVSGWVETDDGSVPDRVSVELAPSQAQAPTTREDLELFKAHVLTTAVGENGFFTFSGVQPASYRLAASADGYVDAVATAVPVLENAETEIADPLILRHPVTADFLVEPPLDPSEKPWAATLHHELDLPGREDIVGDYAVGEDGSFSVTGLAPGRYAVGLVDSGGNAFARTDVVVGDQDGFYDIELPIVRVEGDVRIGDTPLPADVYFGGRRGVERIHAESDQEGDFGIYLPREGLWVVDVISGDESVTKRFPDVVVREGSHGVAKVELALPNTFLEGRAIDDLGLPVNSAQVLVKELRTRAIAHKAVDEAGEFVFMGLDEGLVSIEAEAFVDGETLAADGRVVALSEGVSPGVQELVLRRTTKLSGRVVSGAGSGVPGAWVVGMFANASGIGFGTASATANVDGEFTLKVPNHSGSVDLWAMPVGCSLTYAQLQTRSSEPVTLACNDDSGTVTIRYPDDPPPEDRWRLPLVLTINGAFLDLQMLERWSRVNQRAVVPRSDSLVVTNMPAGDYRLCLLEPEGSAAFLTTGDMSTARCSAGFLGRYGTLELAVP
jgi:hypothetical protein